MSPTTTYQLMEKSIYKDDEKWVKEKDRFAKRISPIIKEISNNQGPKVEKALENLYPIHPYTSFLATFIAREIGSTERSIFRFLHDDVEFGFRSFINTYEVNERFFLTADYLWDFFYSEFEQNDNVKISTAIQRFILHEDIIKEEDEEYLAIFKVILLLNILYKLAEISDKSPAIPSEKNISNVFLGSIYEDKVTKALNFIDAHGIINRSPDDLFELTSNALPTEKIDKERKKLENLKLLDILSSNQINSIKKSIEDKINRHTEVDIVNANIPKNNLLSLFSKDNSNPAFLHIYLFLCKDVKEFNQLEEIINSISNEDIIKNKIIVISRAFLEDDSFKKYVEYTATSKVAEELNQTEEMERNSRNANMIVDSWVNDIKRKHITYHLNGSSDLLELPDFTNKMNRLLSKEIFKQGLENLNNPHLNKKPVWKKTSSFATALAFISSKSYKALDDTLKGQNAPAIHIVYDNNGNPIVNSKLEILDTIPEKHPIKLLQNVVDEKLVKAQQKGKFNLGIELKELIEPPFGLYKNVVNIAALSFVLRRYVKKFYDFDGYPINETNLSHKIIDLFEYWDGNHKKENNLNIRFGSEYEKKLINLLVDIFKLDIDDEKQAINNVRWAIHTQWTKVKKVPIWLLKYSTNVDDKLDVAIDSLFNIIKPDNLDIPDSDIQDCYEKLSECEFEFKILLKDYYEDLYKNLILSTYERVSQEDIEKIITYIIEEMPEDGYYEESVVTKKIYHWIIERKDRTPPTPTPTPAPVGTETVITDKDFTSFLNKIRKTNSEKLKSIVIQALKDHKEIKEILDQYLED